MHFIIFELAAFRFGKDRKPYSHEIKNLRVAFFGNSGYRRL